MSSVAAPVGTGVAGMRAPRLACLLLAIDAVPIVLFTLARGLGRLELREPAKALARACVDFGDLLFGLQLCAAALVALLLLRTRRSPAAALAAAVMCILAVAQMTGLHLHMAHDLAAHLPFVAPLGLAPAAAGKLVANAAIGMVMLGLLCLAWQLARDALDLGLCRVLSLIVAVIALGSGLTDLVGLLLKHLIPYAGTLLPGLEMTGELLGGTACIYLLLSFAERHAINVGGAVGWASIRRA